NNVNFIDQELSWQLQTCGSNLRDMMVDPLIKDCYTNDIHETYTVLGIEAARSVILTEILKVLQSDGSYVNIRHLLLLIDIMTYNGVVLGITRHGINRKIGSPLMRCTFEETVEILLDAACKGEISHMQSVSEGIMAGNIVKCGTGQPTLLLDMKLITQGEKFTFLENKGELINMNEKDDNISFIYSPSSVLGSPSIHSPSMTSPGDYSPMSPKYSPMSPKYSPMSPKYSPVSPKYSPMSPKYSPVSPKYSPMSPKYNPMSPKYTPMSPKYSPRTSKYSPLSPKKKDDSK
ncbi:RNA polymerase II, large subunit, partial [Pseudoloma neurophilia]